MRWPIPAGNRYIRNIKNRGWKDKNNELITQTSRVEHIVSLIKRLVFVMPSAHVAWQVLSEISSLSQ